METRGSGYLTGEERTWGMLAHLLGAAGYFFAVLGWLGPLVVYFTKRDSSHFAAFHGLQSLLFQLIWLAFLTMGWTVTFALMMVLVGVLLIPLMAVLSFVPVIWAVVAAIKVNNGEWYEYPVVGRWALKHTGGP